MTCPRNNPPGSCNLPNVHCRYPECEKDDSMTPTPREKPTDAQRVRLADIIRAYYGGVDVLNLAPGLADALLAAGYIHRDDAAEIVEDARPATQDMWSTQIGEFLDTIAAALRQKGKP